MNIKKKIMSAKGETLNREVHPNWYIDIPGMKTLILGSYPPHEDKRHFEFFYPNKINRFWKILAEINGSALQYFENEKAVEERKAIMNSLKVGVQNLGKVILRKGKSARDLDIQILEFQDILNIISRNPNLERVLLPGISGPSSTYYLFLKYLKLNHIDIGEAPSKPKGGNLFEINIGSRSIQCVVANSTSTQAFRVKFESLVEQFRMAIN